MYKWHSLYLQLSEGQWGQLLSKDLGIWILVALGNKNCRRTPFLLTQGPQLRMCKLLPFSIFSYTPASDTHVKEWSL